MLLSHSIYLNENEPLEVNNVYLGTQDENMKTKQPNQRYSPRIHNYGLVERKIILYLFLEQLC